MTDMQECAVCGGRFDFDEGGLASDAGYVVCSGKCAKSAASLKGRAYAIHDATDAIVDTNATAKELEKDAAKEQP